MLRLGLILCLTCIMNQAYADNMVIIHSKSAYSRGQLLDQDASLQLKAGETITVVFPSGSVVTKKGTYQGKLRDPLMHQIKSNKHLVNGLSELILSYRPPRGGKNDGSIWSVDISGVHERHYCVMPERRIVLSRHETESKAASRLSLKHKKTGTKTELTWPAYSATLAWPNKIPIVYGDTYTLETENMMKGTKHFKKVILHRMPKNLPTKSHKVVWMAGKGCVSQANMLLASMH